MGIIGSYVIRTLPLTGRDIKWNRARRTRRVFRMQQLHRLPSIQELMDHPRGSLSVARAAKSR